MAGARRLERIGLLIETVQIMLCGQVFRWVEGGEATLSG